MTTLFHVEAQVGVNLQKFEDMDAVFQKPSNLAEFSCQLSKLSLPNWITDELRYITVICVPISQFLPSTADQS